MILLKEVDRPKSFGEKIAEYLARPPQPVLKFYGDFTTELSDNGRYILFAVRNGLPIPLLYGIYVKVTYDSLVDYIEITDHIGMFSTDNWRLTLDTTAPTQIELRLGLVPMEILLDKSLIAV